MTPRKILTAFTAPHLNVTGIKPGEYAFFDTGFRGGRRQNQYLVIRQFDSSVDVFVIDTKNEEFVMPDTHWWGMSGTCKELSLPPPRGPLERNGDIRCLNVDQGEWSNNRWRWDYKEKNVSKHYDNLFNPKFAVEDGEIVIGKWRQRQQYG